MRPRTGDASASSRHTMPQAAAEYGWVPDIEPGPDEDAWHPHDELLAPLYDEQGDLIGLLSIDIPLNGRRPDAAPARAARALRRPGRAGPGDRGRARGAVAPRPARRGDPPGRAVRGLAARHRAGPRRLPLRRCSRASAPTTSRSAPTPATACRQGGSPSMQRTAATSHRHVHVLSRACWKQQRVGLMTGDVATPTDLDRRGRLPTCSGLRRASTASRSAMLVPIGAGQLEPRAT